MSPVGGGANIARVRGIDIHYVDRGVGYPLLFVHGHPFDHTVWEPQIRALAGRGFRVIAPDLRGYGRSTVVPGVTTMDVLARDLASLLEHVGLDPVGVVGASMGGRVALELWRLFPERVDSLVLAATSPHAETERERAEQRAVAARLRAEGAGGYADEVFAGVMARDNVRALPEVADRVRAMGSAVPSEGAAAALSGLAECAGHVPLLRHISVPTLLVVGREDGFVPLDCVEAMHVRIPDSMVEVIEGAGHVPNLERPERFNEVVCRFLERSGVRRRTRM